MSKFNHRVIVPEIIDDFNLSGADLNNNLEEIEWINKYLGGTSTSAYPVFTYVQKNLRHTISITDVGCGSGDLLKKIYDNCKGIAKVKLTGVDANPHIIKFAKQKHFQKDEVNFVMADIMNESEKIPSADIYMLNLFLHHFTEVEVKKIIGNLISKNPSLIVINDLERSRLSYFLFSMLCKIKNASFVTFNDGRLSILKGFRRKELKSIATVYSGYEFELKWKWAFRWQLLLRKKQ